LRFMAPMHAQKRKTTFQKQLGVARFLVTVRAFSTTSK
jgi:hypothetical protein